MLLGTPLCLSCPASVPLTRVVWPHHDVRSRARHSACVAPRTERSCAPGAVPPPGRPRRTESLGAGGPDCAGRPTGVSTLPCHVFQPIQCVMCVRACALSSQARVLVVYGDVMSTLGAFMPTPLTADDVRSIAVCTDGAAGACSKCRRRKHVRHRTDWSLSPISCVHCLCAAAIVAGSDGNDAVRPLARVLACRSALLGTQQHRGSQAPPMDGPHLRGRYNEASLGMALEMRYPADFAQHMGTLIRYVSMVHVQRTHCGFVDNAWTSAPQAVRRRLIGGGEHCRECSEVAACGPALEPHSAPANWTGCAQCRCRGSVPVSASDGYVTRYSGHTRQSVGCGHAHVPGAGGGGIAVRTDTGEAFACGRCGHGTGSQCRGSCAAAGWMTDADSDGTQRFAFYSASSTTPSTAKPGPNAIPAA